MKAIRLILFFLILGVQLGHAQDMSIRFEQITTEDGLSQSTVNTILQDSRGFLWFATEDGLNRYDGYEFKIYRNDPYDFFSISSNQISSIIEDVNGAIWVGTKGGGLNRLDREKDRFIRFIHNSEDDKSISHNYINVLFEDETGVLLVGTQNGLNILDPITNEFSVYSQVDEHTELREARITTLFRDTNDFIWIGTEEVGLFRFDRINGDILHFEEKSSTSNIPDDWIVTLYEDKSGVLWVGTQSGGLLRYNKEEQTFTSFTSVNSSNQSISNNWVLSLYEDSRGTFWVGTLNGLNILNRDSGMFTSFMDLNYPINLSNNSISALYEDRSGVFWVGTRNGALNKFIRSSSESFTIYQNEPANSNSLSNNNIWAISEDDNGDVWIGTQGGGLNKLNVASNTFRNFKHDPDDEKSLSNDFVNAIIKDVEGKIWVGTIDGLNLYDEEQNRFIHFKNLEGDETTISGNIITTIFEDSRGIIWVGTLNNGLNAYDKETGKFRRFQNNETDPSSISHNKIWSMFEDSRGVFWVGTHGFGLNKYDRARGNFTTYANNPSDDSSISDNFINVITQDTNGDLWVGTINGLNKFNPESETFTRFTTSDGLPNNVIYGIIEDYRGHLWLSTNSGIADFDPDSKSVRIYDRGDGLPSNEYRFGAFHKAEDGTMYFGGINGVVVFKPDSIRDNPYIPPVVVTSFQIFNQDVFISPSNSPLKKSIIETDEIILTWRENVISFEFAALHFAAPEQNQYQYMMEGFDNDWQDVGNRRFVSYTNLPEGYDYTFRVKASNKDGIWNEEGRSIKLKILPPPWKTWWAYSIYSALGAGLLIGFINFQISRERKKKEQVEQYNEELEALVKERTILLENEKEKSDTLLYNMLPKDIADEIKEKGSATPRRYEEVSVLFTDFENFTSTAATMSAKKLVSEINEIFEAFDNIVEKYKLEKIKTIGDAYMAVSGLPKEKEDHAYLCVTAAKEMQDFIRHRNENAAVKWRMRIGIHSGSIIAGIVGKKKFTYDIWGSTVILASRMEEVGEIGRVNISATTCDYVQDYYNCEYRGKVSVEGQGEMDMYFVDDLIKEMPPAI
ncbi:MAG: sensor histidine kinase [Balneolaceae bacterium]